MIDPTTPGAVLLRRKSASLGDQSRYWQAAALFWFRQRVDSSESGSESESEDRDESEEVDGDDEDGDDGDEDGGEEGVRAVVVVVELSGEVEERGLRE